MFIQIADTEKEENSRRKRAVDTVSWDVSIADVDPISLAVDWIGNNIYWIDGNLGKPVIQISDLDGLVRRKIVTKVLEKPQSIVLDPTRG